MPDTSDVQLTGSMTENSRTASAVEEQLRLQIDAYHASAMVYTAAKLGLADRMGFGRWTAEQLAKELRLSPAPLIRFLRGLSTVGLCAELPDQTFALTSAGLALKADLPSCLREKVMIVVEQYWQPWANLIHSLQTGSPAFDHVFGMAVWDWRRLHSEHGALFDSWAAHESLAQAGAIVEALDLSGVGTVADIGGGGGGLIAALVRAYPKIACVLFDQPQTIETAEKVIASGGLAERVKLVAGDFFAEIPVLADLYLLKCVLHDWDDAKCQVILTNCRAVMPDRARLLVIERHLPERAFDDLEAIKSDLHMMAITGGKERSLEQFSALLARSGLAIAKVYPTRSGLSIIEALPA